MKEEQKELIKTFVLKVLEGNRFDVSKLRVHVDEDGLISLQGTMKREKVNFPNDVNSRSLK